MKPSKNAVHLLNLLHKLGQVKREELNIELFKGLSKSFKEYNYLSDDSWFKNDLTPYFKDRFLEFAGQDGNLFCLWYYPGLTGEPPVVLIGQDSNSCTVAPSLNDFICLNLMDMEPYYFETKPKNIWTALDLDYFKEELPKTYNDIVNLRNVANNEIECDDYKQIIKRFKNYPKFDKWIEKVNQKDKKWL